MNPTTFVLNPFLVTVYDLSECCVSILVATTEIERPVSGSWVFVISEIVSELFVVVNTLSAFKYVLYTNQGTSLQINPTSASSLHTSYPVGHMHYAHSTTWKPWHNVQGVPDTVSTYGKLETRYEAIKWGTIPIFVFVKRFTKIFYFHHFSIWPLYLIYF